MARCIDCHWFDSPPPVGRKPQRCDDAGELAQSNACNNFIERDVDDPLPILKKNPISPEEGHAIIGALQHESYKNIFAEVIAETFVLEQDAQLALKSIQDQLRSQGSKVELTGDEYMRTVGRVIDLYQTYRLLLAVGMGGFAEEIMGHEIAKKFKSKVAEVKRS